MLRVLVLVQKKLLICTFYCRHIFFFHFHFAACSSESKSFPYLCLDATFIVTLFKEGYGFSDDRPLTVGVVDVLFL